MKRIRTRLSMKALADSAPQLIGRLRLLVHFRGYIQSNIDKFREAPLFRPLLDSLNEFDALLIDGERIFFEAGSGNISSVDFETYLGDFVRDLSEHVSEHSPIGCGVSDPDEGDTIGLTVDLFMERQWRELAGLVEQLQDGLQSITPHLPLLLPWQAPPKTD